MQRLFITALAFLICISSYSQSDEEIYDDLLCQVSYLQDSLWALQDSMDMYTNYEAGESFSFGTLYPSNKLFAGDLSTQGKSDLFDGLGSSWTAKYSVWFVTDVFDSPNIDLYLGNSYSFSRFETIQDLEAVDGAIQVMSDGTTNFVSVDSSNVIHNSLNIGYIGLPILLHVGKSNQFSEKGVHSFIGIVPGIRCFGTLRSKLDNGESETNLISRDFGLSRFQLNGRLSFGIKHLEIFAETSLLPLFKKVESNPIVYPLTLGVSCIRNF